MVDGEKSKIDYIFEKKKSSILNLNLVMAHLQGLKAIVPKVAMLRLRMKICY